MNNGAYASARRGRVFISYAREDFACAIALRDALEQKNIPVWLDQARLQPGHIWSQQILHAIEACEIFFVVLSPNVDNSSYVHREIAAAVEYKKRIFTCGCGSVSLTGGETSPVVNTVQHVPCTDGRIVRQVQAALRPRWYVLASVCVLAALVLGFLVTTLVRADLWFWAGIAAAVIFCAVAATVIASPRYRRKAVLEAKIPGTLSWVVLGGGIVLMQLCLVLNLLAFPPRVVFIVIGPDKPPYPYQLHVLVNGDKVASPTWDEYQVPFALGCRATATLKEPSLTYFKANGFLAPSLGALEAKCVPVRVGESVAVQLFDGDKARSCVLRLQPGAPGIGIRY